MTETHDLLTGSDAVERMTDSWQQIGAGMVDLRVSIPWFIVGRKGLDYTLFLSLADGTAVAVEEPDAGRSDLPDGVLPSDTIGKHQIETVQRAFDNAGGGSFPLPDDGVFSLGFRDENGMYRALHVGLTDDTLEVRDRQ